MTEGIKALYGSLFDAPPDVEETIIHGKKKKMFGTSKKEDAANMPPEAA